MWSEAEIKLDLLDDLTAGEIATLLIRTPAGAIMVMGVPSPQGMSLTVEGVHAQGLGIGANSVGASGLRTIADAVMTELGYDELVVQGALRTSGANPGRRPRVLRFARRGGSSRGT